MLKAHNISFLRLLTVGYISSETYHAVKSYGTIGNLSIDDLCSFSDSCQNELKKLFSDADTVLNIALLEEADLDLAENKGVVMQVLNGVVACMNANNFISTIGKRRFISDYAFCTREVLKESYAASKLGYTNVVRFVNRFRLAYQSKLLSQEVKVCSNPGDICLSVEDVTSGVGFTGKDLIVIEDNALSAQNKKANFAKYVKLLYSLNKEQFHPCEEFILSYPFSKRTINCIREIGVRNFFVNYLFAEPVKMLTIRNFGRKSYSEIENSRQEIISYVIEYIRNSEVVINIELEEKKLDTKHLSLIEVAGKDKYQLIVAKFKEFLENSTLSVRARNGIANYDGDFIEDFVHFHKDIKALQNIGKKTETEIKSFIERLAVYTDEIIERDFSDEERTLLLLKSKYGIFLDEYACDVYYNSKQLPMFHITENILKAEWNNRDNKLLFLNALLPMLKDGISSTLEQIASEKNLTRERVRQVCNKGIKYLYGELTADDSDKVNFANVISQSESWAYVKNALGNEAVIKSTMVEELLIKEKSNLAVSVALVIVFRIFNGEYSFVGNRPYEMETRSKSLWKNSFLVRQELADAFDFDEMHRILDCYMEETFTEETMEQTAEELVLDLFLSSWIVFDSSKVEAVADVVSEILIKEYGFIPDEEFRFFIQGEKVATAADVLYKALYEKGEPISIDELYKILQAKMSYKYKSSASVKNIAAGDVRLCMVGVNNLVALREWNHIKIGSVRNIIVQYLEQFDEPKSVQDIVKYVLRYRDTTENSIRSTMYSGSQFRQFDNGCFGLADKSYHNEELYAQPLEFKQRIQDLECFLKSKKHFPFSCSDDNFEVNLRKWWNRNKDNESLNDIQQNEIKRIKESYWFLPTDKREVKWFDSLCQYKDFVLLYNRKPSIYIEREKSLALWFVKAQGNFMEGELSDSEEKVYLHLCKIL